MELEDDELELAFVSAPEQNLRAIYDRYSGSLFRFLYRFTTNNQVSEEILHDIFLELLNGRFKSSENGTLKSWLFTVAKNRGLNYQRKAARETKEDISEVKSDRNIEEETIHSGLLAHLAKVETNLPNDLKETWNLRKTGYDYQQIAKTLSIPVGTVKSRFSRIVELLRKEFDQ